MDTFEWTEETPVTANNMNEMENILNGNITSSIANQYNLISDSDAVKTGRQIDGKDEYVKRFHFTEINSVSTFSKNLGFTLNDVIITSYDAWAYTNSSNWMPMPMGDFSNATGYAIRFGLIDTSNTLQLNTINTNFSNAYINIYYIYRN